MRMAGRKRIAILAVSTVLLVFFGNRSEAGELQMRHVPVDFGASPKILGGQTATPSDWPATLVFTTDSGDYCTATVIGERILVTAAHCIVDNSVGQVTWNNDHVKVNCEHHKDYDDSPIASNPLPCHLRAFPNEFLACTADIALCIVADDNKKFTPSVGRYERIRTASPAAVAGTKITLLGYGCVAAGVKTNGILSFGPAKITHMSQPDPSADLDKTLGKFILTEGVGVCNGDSGGAGYSSTDKQTREIVGINARGNLTKGSNLVNVVDSRIAQFFTEFFADRKNYKEKDKTPICGLDPEAMNCAF
jgi:trypsin